MDPVASRGSQSPSTPLESEVLSSGVVPKEGSARPPPATSCPATSNTVQSYLPTGGGVPESMCRASPPPFSEPQGEELKLLEQFHTRRAEASMGRGVELCKGPMDVPIARAVGLKHHWLRTSTREAGLGRADETVPDHRLKLPFIVPTQLNDHTGRGERSDSKCTRVENVDEACVNRELEQLGKPLGIWTPTNQCQVYAASVLEQCSTKPPSTPEPREPESGKR